MMYNFEAGLAAALADETLKQIDDLIDCLNTKAGNEQKRIDREAFRDAARARLGAMQLGKALTFPPFTSRSEPEFSSLLRGRAGCSRSFRRVRARPGKAGIQRSCGCFRPAGAR